MMYCRFYLLSYKKTAIQYTKAKQIHVQLGSDMFPNTDVLSSPFQETESADVSWLPVWLGDRERVCSQAPEQMCADAFGQHKRFPRGSLLGP